MSEAADGDTAVQAAADLQPDVILMDLNMPGVNGVEATRRIVRTSPHIATSRRRPHRHTPFPSSPLARSRSCS